MRVESRSETITIEAGLVRLAFDLADCEARYLIVTLPWGEGAGATEAFFGEDHHVELKDQLFGRYGGLETLRVEGDRQLSIALREPVPGIGSRLTIVTHEPLSEELRRQLRRLEHR